MAAATTSDYPVRYSVDYPDGARNRLTAAFRLLLAIPIIVLFGLLSGGGSGGAGWQANETNDVRIEQSADGVTIDGETISDEVIAAIVGAVIVVVLFAPAAVSAAMAFAPATAPLSVPAGLMLIFRRKYPRWFLDFNREVARFGGRVAAYGSLQRDEYPSTDDEQASHLEIDEPDAARLNRWLPLVKWLLAVPHYIVLFFLYIGLVFTTFVAWLAILVTGRYPRGLWNYSVGVSRWAARVSGYAFLLVTDRYPPFSLS